MLLVLAAGMPVAAQAPAAEFTAKAEVYMAAQMRVNQFMGTVLVAHKGEVLLRKGYGFADLEHNVPNTPLTKFRLGSVTKQFTAAAILLLEQQGKLRVQDPLCKFIENCPDAWQPVTLHHLLTHTSGIPNFTSFADYLEKMALPCPPECTIARFRDRPLEFPPGERWAYSNSGYILLGYIIEKVTGQPYDQFLRQNILEPLALDDTGYDHTAEILPHRARGYSRQSATLRNAAYLDMTIPHAAGALYSTVEDLYRWDQALYTDMLLPAAAREVMFTPVKNNYAYGWGVREQFGRTMMGHGGGINGFSTFIARYPEERTTVIVLSNVEQGNAGQVARDLAAILFGAPYELPRERTAIELPPEVLERYTGRYMADGGLSLEITREGNRLFVQLPGQPKVEVFAEAEDSFFLRVVEAQFTVQRDATGKITGLRFVQGGTAILLRRVD
jgi:CubicO group peptidase (beta-lactamase class C family)